MNIYLDHAATTPVDKRVVNAMRPYLQNVYGNPSAIYTSGREASHALESARQSVKTLIGASKDDIVVFTGSGTESDNLAVFGIARQYKGKGKHIIVSTIEHKAVLESAECLEREGFEVTYVGVNKDGVIDVEVLEKSIRNDTTFISVMYANNEIGTIQPIKEISNIVKRKRGNNVFPFFHTDACQAVGALPLNVTDLGIDLLTINGSKICGPKGIGVLYIKENISIQPILVGGGQEFGIRAGTENVALAVGLSNALKLALDKEEKESVRLIELRDYFIKRIKDEIGGITINGHETLRLPNNIHFLIDGIEGESLVMLLDEHEIASSTGSACSSHDLHPSHVLQAIGVSPELAHGSLRLTMGRTTKKEELDYVLEALKEAIDRLRMLSSVK